MNEEVLKMFEENGVSAEEIFDKMEKTVPLARCRECVHRHNAMRGGVNIFCSYIEGEYDYTFVTDCNASDCKHFKQKTDDSDELEKMAINELISKMR